MSEFVSVGKGCFVRRSEIAAIHVGTASETERESMAVDTWAWAIRAVIQLRDGHLFPCYVTAKTLMRRMEEASSDA